MGGKMTRNDHVSELDDFILSEENGFDNKSYPSNTNHTK